MEAIFKLGYELIATAHVAHLQTRSYAQHLALGEIYGELPGLLDSLLESWQGKNGTVIKDIGSINVGNLANCEEYLGRMLRYCESQLPVLPLDIQDELLTIVNFLNSIKYKFTLK